MFSLSYAFKHIYRSFIKCFSMMCIILAFILLFCNFSNSIREQEINLDIVYKTLPVHVDVSDYRGNNKDRLTLSDGTYFQVFFEKAYGVSQYLKDVCLKRELNILRFVGTENLDIKKDTLKLIGVSNLNYSKHLYNQRGYDFEVEFQEDFDYDVFISSSNYCIINEELLSMIGKQIGDTVSFTLITEPSVYSARDDDDNLLIIPVDAQFEIIGSIKGGKINEIYCSWEKAAELGGKSDRTGAKYTDILRATIKDNYKLNEFKSAAKKYYVSVNAKIFSGGYYALIVYDDIFTQTVTQIQRNIQFLKAVYPLMVIFSFIIGYLVSYLFTRNRKKELAVMRSLGVSKFKSFITIMIELFTINIVGTLIGILICNYILKINITMNEILLFFIFNIFGAALSTIRISSGSVMSIMKDKE